MDRIPTAGRFGTGRTSPVMFAPDQVETFGSELRAIAEAKAAA